MATTNVRFSAEIGSAVLAFSVILGEAGNAKSEILFAAPTTLGAVLANAKAGDTLILKAGSYQPLELHNMTFEPPITIIGKADASMQGLRLTSVRGIRISGVELAGPPQGRDYPFFLSSSSNIIFQNLRVSANPGAWGALRLENCHNVSILESEFRGAFTAISWSKCGDFEVSDSVFHDLVSDGISGAGGSRIRFKRNFFHDFRPTANNHPDAIQIWSIPNTISSDIVIENNRYIRGDVIHSRPTQGIFITGGGANPRLRDVKVAGNTILGGMYNGIMVTGADGVEIVGNYVTGYQDQASWIRYDDNSAQKILNNQAQAYISRSQPPGGRIAPKGNGIIPALLEVVSP